MAEFQLTKQITRELTQGVYCNRLVSGFTHKFYTYPARFSPSFAAAAINCFSDPGDIVLDPYMGGGTTIVEAMVANRRPVGIDLNSLAVFIAKVKTTRLNNVEMDSISHWADKVIPMIRYHQSRKTIHKYIDKDRMKNLNLSKSRFITKFIALTLKSIDELPSERARDFAKCAVLNTGKWALDGRKHYTSLSNFRERLPATELQRSCPSHVKLTLDKSDPQFVVSVD